MEIIKKESDWGREKKKLEKEKEKDKDGMEMKVKGIDSKIEEVEERSR